MTPGCAALRTGVHYTLVSVWGRGDYQRAPHRQRIACSSFHPVSGRVGPPLYSTARTRPDTLCAFGHASSRG